MGDQWLDGCGEEISMIIKLLTLKSWQHASYFKGHYKY